MAADNLLLAGIRVLDLGTHPSAALASMVLADFGADVACVAARAVQEHPAAPMLLRGKRVLEAKGADYDKALAEADVLITTLGPGEAAPAGRADLIHMNISGWGMKGPYARYPMSEGLVAAKSGRMASFEGQIPREGPVYTAVQVATFAASQIAVQGIVAALMLRDHSTNMRGRGQRVETSLLQAIMPYDTSGFVRAQLEPRYPKYLPPEPVSEKLPRINYQPIQAKDGRWMQQGNLLDHLFKSFLKVAGLMDAIPEAERKKAGTAWSKETTEMMRAAIMKRIRERTAAEWIADFKADGNIAVAAYQSTQEALDDPDFVISGAVVDAEHPRHGKVRWLGPAAHMEGTPASITVQPRAAASPGAGSASAGAARAGGAAGAGPLSGLTILEFASIIATPMGVSMLGDLGARVIKVEPMGGDPGRRIGGAMAAGLGSVKFNVGKDSICIELKSPKGREILDRLLPKADVIAHNFRPGVPDKLGFGYERAKTFNPNVVWISANGFGPTAPSADSPCSHPIAGALSGGASWQAGVMPPATDDVEALIEGARRVMRANEVNPDPNTSMIVATAGLLGLYAAQRYGIGQRINVDMMLANAWANFDDALRYAGKPARPVVDAEGYGLHALYRLYPCASGWVFLAVEDRDFAALCEALGAQGLAADARFGDAQARRANDAALAAQLGAALRKSDADDWERRLCGLGCVRADAAVAGEFWLPDPHMRENAFVRAVPHARYGDMHRHGPLMTFSAAEVRCGAPTLAGEHTDALLRELGYDEAAIASLRAEGVVWSEPVSVEEAFG